MVFSIHSSVVIVSQSEIHAAVLPALKFSGVFCTFIVIFGLTSISSQVLPSCTEVGSCCFRVGWFCFLGERRLKFGSDSSNDGRCCSSVDPLPFWPKKASSSRSDPALPLSLLCVLFPRAIFLQIVSLLKPFCHTGTCTWESDLYEFFAFSIHWIVQCLVPEF